MLGEVTAAAQRLEDCALAGRELSSQLSELEAALDRLYEVLQALVCRAG